jgi:hypothetical protein
LIDVVLCEVLIEQFVAEAPDLVYMR